jgi:hypothetical protein
VPAGRDDTKASSGVGLGAACFKPRIFLSKGTTKYTFVPSPKTLLSRHKEISLIFHPRLGNSFLFYFKNRQKAHIELTFYISEKERITWVKRKITCGSLEADLLSSRYITHCLFLQKNYFAPGRWHSVKIDLSREDD